MTATASLGSGVHPRGRTGSHFRPSPPAQAPLRPVLTLPPHLAGPAGARREDGRARLGAAYSRPSKPTPTPGGPASLPTRPGNPPPPLWFAAGGESTELDNYLELHRAAITPEVRHFPFPATAGGGKRNVKYIKS